MDALRHSRVFHDQGILSVLQSWVGEPLERKFPDDFVEVAECDGNSLERAFFLTNHVHGAWWENEGVRKLIEQEVRSTSVGDVVVLDDGSAHVCRSMGWAKIGNINEGQIVFKSGMGVFDGK